MGDLRIPVLLGSVRRKRQSPKVARWITEALQADDRITSELLDLEGLALPIMEERVRMRDDSPPGAVKLSEALAAADSLVIVSPEYNNGYPGVLKNALDYLLPELKRKPVGIVTVSAGGFGGVSCLAQFGWCCWPWARRRFRPPCRFLASGSRFRTKARPTRTSANARVVSSKSWCGGPRRCGGSGSRSRNSHRARPTARPVLREQLLVRRGRREGHRSSRLRRRRPQRRVIQWLHRRLSRAVRR